MGTESAGCYAFDERLRRRLARHLADFRYRAIEDAALSRAAVAIVLVAGGHDGAAGVLLTRRARHLKRHGNQFALPGGRMEPSESAIDGALRELAEELGFECAASQVLGLLDDFPTRSGFLITPVVVWGRADPCLVPDPGEVDKVFRIPLAELDRPEIPQLAALPGGEHPVLSVPLPTLGHPIYAPTAAVLYQFREVALRGCATRVAHYEQPEFAWK